KPIIGCEVYIAGGSRFEKEGRERTPDGFDAISHLLLLAMNEAGYRNLMYLVSKGYLEGFYYKPRIDKDLLRSRNEGLIATSGCLSAPVPRAIVQGETNRAWSVAEEFKGIFGDRYYLEMQRHGIPAQDQVNAELVKMSSDLGLPLVATNDAHYLAHADHAHHDALLCIGTASNLDDPSRFKFDGQGFYVKDGDEMREVFHDHPAAIENALEIAERCNVEIPMGAYHMPEYQVPAGRSLDEVMEEQAWVGLRERLGLAPDEPLQESEYADRMKHELSVIKEMGFAGYFLIVADFISYARRNGVPVGPGRGSSAGSLVAFGMGITGVDPVHYGIIFERFLNPERVSMPDIDVDFCMRGRDKVIRYVADKYGSGRPADDSENVEGRYDDVTVAQIVTFGTLQPRAAIRDVGRVLGMSYGDVDRVAKLIPEILGISLSDAIKKSPELRARVDTDGQVRQLIDTALNLEGLTRHASKHTAGVVIGNKPLIELVPLYRDPKSGDVMSQYNMVCVEKIGLIKFDFLGLRTLTVMADAEAMIRERHDSDFRYEGIPLDDEKTFDMLCAGRTEGVFQVESSGMTDLILRQKPRVFDDLVPLVALFRPGPLESGMVEDYINRRNGTTRVEYAIPELEEVTAPTLGVICYQDQVLQIAQQVAGYSLGEADLLRRAMGKKKPKEMAEQKSRFIEGASANGIDETRADTLFDQIAKFAAYGFPKAHAVAYALIVYQTAYLKANYPHEFLAALLTIESGNHDKLSRYIAHCRERGISILPPDVNESGKGFSVIALESGENAIRFGFSGIKNVGAGAVDHLLEARESGGRFESLFDFLERIDGRKLNRKVVESLVKSGTFDTLHENRNAVWCSLDAALERSAAVQRDRAVGQESLFANLTGADALDEPSLPDVPRWTEREQLSYEKELLGFYVTGHPLRAYATDLARFADTTSSLTEGKAGREVRVAGLLVGLRESRTRRGGKRMAYGILEDLEGTFEVLIFSSVFERHGALLTRAMAGDDGAGPLPLLMTGNLEAGDPPKILVRELMPLADAEQNLTIALRVRLREEELSEDRLVAMRGILESHRGDCPVFVHITIPGESETVLAVGRIRGVDPSDGLRRQLDSLFGRVVSERGL
ncbi:MAG: DNA polymerase III subunit alpha, partial [Myxococcota bacterium]